MTGSKIHVLIADDHPVVREGLHAILLQQEDMEVVGAVATGQEAVESSRQRAPDVVLVDLNMPGLDGIATIQLIRSVSPRSRFIVLTVHEGDEDVRRAFDAGAHAYLLKNSRREQLLEAIRAVSTGHRMMSDPIAAKLGERPAELTDRELEVLHTIARGLTNREIGHALGITEGTVKTHVVNILTKLQASDRTEAVTTALHRGILHLD